MIVTIPSIGGSLFLPDLLDVLVNDGAVERILLVDNSPGAGSGPARTLIMQRGSAPVRAAVLGGRIDCIRNPGCSLYAAWNYGIDAGRDVGANVACLNDDLVLRRDALRAAEAGFGFGPYGMIGLNYFQPGGPVDGTLGVRTVGGTYRHHGVGGFAFLVRPDTPHVDERFRWWYGDDDLAMRVMGQERLLGIALGAPVDHPAPSTTGIQHPWTAEVVAGDAALWAELWPDAA